MFLTFLECVKIASVGLKLDRPQLQHWLLFLEHSLNRFENSNVVVDLPMGYDCVYDSACVSCGPFDFELRISPALVEFEY